MEPLENSRLRLRPWRPEEAPRLFDVLRREDVTRWFGEASRAPLTELAQAAAKIAEWAETCRRDAPLGVWAVEVHDRPDPVGSAMLFRAPNAEDGEVEVGWYLHPDARGHGYATEAVRTLVRHAGAAGYAEVWALTHTTNHASRAVCARAGLRDLGVVDGLWHDGESQLFVAETGCPGRPETP